jgi:myo-inositol catabolism protein IolH
VQIALDPYMFRTTPLTELPGLVADLGYEHIELSPRELGCTVMNSEFNGRPEQAARSEGQFWRSMEELLPVFEREGVRLVLEPHTFHMGGDLAGVIEIGQGEVAWDGFFGALRRLRFDGVMTACVFAWEDRAHASTRFMREQLNRYTKDWPV